PVGSCSPSYHCQAGHCHFDPSSKRELQPRHRCAYPQRRRARRCSEHEKARLQQLPDNRGRPKLPRCLEKRPETRARPHKTLLEKSRPDLMETLLFARTSQGLRWPRARKKLHVSARCRISAGSRQSAASKPISDKRLRTFACRPQLRLSFLAPTRFRNNGRSSGCCTVADGGFASVEGAEEPQRQRRQKKDRGNFEEPDAHASVSLHPACRNEGTPNTWESLGSACGMLPVRRELLLPGLQPSRRDASSRELSE